MTSFAILAIIAVAAFLAVLICSIGKTRKDLDEYDPKVHPELDGGIFDIDLDESFKLSNVLKETWEYFETHDFNDELTELHYESSGEDICCQVSRQTGESGEQEFLLVFQLAGGMDIPSYLEGQPGNTYRVTLKGQDSREEAETVIKEVFGIQSYTKVPYQLAGSDGPCAYFTRLN